MAKKPVNPTSKLVLDDMGPREIPYRGIDKDGYSCTVLQWLIRDQPVIEWTSREGVAVSTWQVIGKPGQQLRWAGLGGTGFESAFRCYQDIKTAKPLDRQAVIATLADGTVVWKDVLGGLPDKLYAVDQLLTVRERVYRINAVDSYAGRLGTLFSEYQVSEVCLDPEGILVPK